MNNSMNNYNKPVYPQKKNSKIMVGIIIIIIGIAFLLKNILPIFPNWIFSWPMFLLALGIFIGARNDFKGNSWWILSSLGIIFLIDKILFSMVFLKPFIFPIILIVIGLLIVLRSRRKQTKLIEQYSQSSTSYNESNPSIIKVEEEQPLVNFTSESSTTDSQTNISDNTNATNNTGSHSFNAQGSGNNYYGKSSFNTAMHDFLQVNAFFGGNSMRVMSNKFKGGSITTLFGSAEVDLGQADFEGLVFIDIFTAFGSVELFVPGDWNVINEITSILGSVEDRRRFAAGTNSKKTLVVKGSVLFGSVEIKNS